MTRASLFVLSCLTLACAAACGQDKGAADTDVVILKQADLKKLDGVREIEGALVIGGGVSGDLSLPDLERVRDSITISSSLHSVSFPALTRIGEAQGQKPDPELAPATSYLKIDDNPGLVRVDAPQLTHMGSLSINSNPALTDVSLPAVREMTAPERFYASLRIGDNLELKTFALPSLAGVIELDVTENLELARLSLPKLEGVHLGLIQLTALETLELSSVKDVSMELTIEAPRLTKLDFSALQTSESLTVEWGQATTLSFPSLTRGNLIIDSLLLKRFEAPKLEETRFLDVHSNALEHVSLPKLKKGCGDVFLNDDFPGCALADSVPLCPPKQVPHTDGCTCAKDGNLHEATCPK